ncbi:MAG: cytochrome C [Deltaproteobacteria bacterium]|nr:cytochrome C [Deltaproteobacteria bacterium]
MENQTHSSERLPKGGWISSLIDLILSYYADLIARPFGSGLVYFLAGFIPALAVGWILFPMALYSKQPQPLNFSHAVHINPDIGISGDTEQERCLYCHAFREDGTFSGIPKLETCMECHEDPESPYGEDPEEQKFLKAYVAEEKEVPWLSYYRQPDCVYFSHIAHVKMGNLDCRTCHGDHGKSENLPPFQQNRLTKYSRNIWGMNIAGYKSNPWDRMKMDDCAECHSKTGHPQNNACFVCHK